MFVSGKSGKVEVSKILFVFSNGSTDAAIVKKECIYILFLDPKEFKPKLLFFALKEPFSYALKKPISQDLDGFSPEDAVADGLYDAKKRLVVVKKLIFF